MTNWVSVTGSRYYPFTKEEWEQLKPDDKLEAIAKGSALVYSNIAAMPLDWGIISGGAKGPDTWAEMAALDQSRDFIKYPAEWDKYGKGAGFKRNKLIAYHADSCLVFWDGVSNGTNHFIKEAYKLRKELFIVGPTGDPWAIFDEEYWANHGEDPMPERMDIP